MFCYLYKLQDDTGIQLDAITNCSSECKNFRDCDECRIGSKDHIELSEDKFGWIINERVNLEGHQSRSGSTKYKYAIHLIHPSILNVWILKCERNHKNSDIWEPIYRFHKGFENVEFESLEELNEWMISQFKYQGTKIKKEYFEEK